MGKVGPPTIAIIIPTKDRLGLLQQCIESITRHCLTDPPIIVVDTGTVGAGDWAIGMAYKVLRMPGATYAQANNAAAQVTRADYLWLLNDDCVLTREVWHGLAFPRDAIVGTRLLYPDGLVQHGGVGFDQDGAPYNLWRLAPAGHPEVMQRRYMRAVTFACALVPRAVWEDLGGLDEGYTNCFEDVDFCLRAGEAGYPVLYEPEACAIHLEGQTAGRQDGIEASWHFYQQQWLATGRWTRTMGVYPFQIKRG